MNKDFDYDFYIYINNLNPKIIHNSKIALEDYENNKSSRTFCIDKEKLKDFDWCIYLLCNKQLNYLEKKDEKTITYHFLKYGVHKECIYNLNHLENILVDFNWFEYLYEHKHLFEQLNNKKACYIHYLLFNIQNKQNYNTRQLPKNFHWLFYKKFYKDLSKLKNEKDLFKHYIFQGIPENRYEWYEMYKNLIYLDEEKYKLENPDLDTFNKEQLIYHWLEHGIYEERLFITNKKIEQYSSFGLAMSLYSDKYTPNERLDASMMCLNYLFLMMPHCKIYLVIDGSILKNHLKFILKLSKYHPNCFIYRNKKNYGIAKTKNICIHLLTQDKDLEYYCLLDDDIYIKKDFTDYIIKIFENTHIPLISNFNKMLPFFENVFSNSAIINSRFYLGNIIAFSKESFYKFGYMQKFDFKWGDEHLELTKRYLRNSKYENCAIDFREYIDDYFIINQKSTLHLHSCSTNEFEVRKNNKQYLKYLKMNDFVDFEFNHDEIECVNPKESNSVLKNENNELKNEEIKQ
jgi:hypothetical protein